MGLQHVNVNYKKQPKFFDVQEFVLTSKNAGPKMVYVREVLVS